MRHVCMLFVYEEGRLFLLPYGLVIKKNMSFFTEKDIIRYNNLVKQLLYYVL